MCNFYLAFLLLFDIWKCKFHLMDFFCAIGFIHTWHVSLCFPTLDPFASLVPPVVLIGQNHVYVDVIVGRRIQNADVEAQEGKHPPG